MTLEWGSFWVGFIAMPISTIVVIALYALVARALSKSHGAGDCRVCDRAFTSEIGEHTRIGIWFRTRKHNWFVAAQKWHRDAWARNRWNPYRLPGYPDDNGTAARRRPKPHFIVRAFWRIVL